MQRLVIKTKSVEYMPFFLSLFCFLCGTSWFIFGLLGRDVFVAVSVHLIKHIILIIIVIILLTLTSFTDHIMLSAV